MRSQGDQDRAAAEAARATWEDLAARARVLHCPDHYVGPWRVNVIGDTPDKFRLYVSGCCPKIGQVVDEMVRRDPRIARGT